MLRLLQYRYTKKLHYGKYVYKVCIRNGLCTMFRREMQRPTETDKFPLVTKTLLQLDEMHKNGLSLKWGRHYIKSVSATEFTYAKELHTLLNQYDDYKLRIARYDMWIYSNDKNLMQDIIAIDYDSVEEFWDVDPEIGEVLKANADISIVDTPSAFDFKVYLKSTGSTSKAVNWCRSNLDKIKIGDQCLSNMEDGVVEGNYFYIRDEKVLMLVRMMIGDSISRVERLVYEGDLDKYTYESK